MTEAVYYSWEEALRLGQAIRLAIDELPCDVAGCDHSAALLIPGAAVCREHADEFRIGGDDRGRAYSVPTERLVGDARWRRARRDLYIERTLDYPLIPRSAERDRLLAGLGDDAEIFGDDG